MSLNPVLAQPVVAHQQAIKENLADSSSVYPIHFKDLKSFTRTGNWVAAVSRERVALYDLVGRRELWSCPLKMREGHHIDQLKVSLQGKIIVITRNYSLLSQQREGHIFFEGRHLGIMDLNPARIHSLDAVKDLFIAVSPSMHEIYISDDLGKVVAQVHTESFSKSACQWILFNENYYVLLGNPKSSWQSTAQVFVYCIATKEKSNFSITSEKILCAALHGDQLVCLLKDSIIELNLLNGISSEFKLLRDLNNPQSLVVHDQYLIFVERDQVTRIQRNTQKMESLLSLPLLYDWGPHLSLEGSLLSVCYYFESSTQPHYMGKKLFLFDLKSEQMLEFEKYFRNPHKPMTFERGKLVMRDDKDLILVKDYNQSEIS